MSSFSTALIAFGYPARISALNVDYERKKMELLVAMMLRCC